MSDNQDWPTGISRTPVHLFFNKKRRAAYKDGLLAYFEGVQLENNPYDDESLAKEWGHGWEAASKKRQQDNKKQNTQERFTVLVGCWEYDSGMKRLVYIISTYG